MKTINFNGYTIVAGQNARENDMLTLQSSGNDMWFHVENIPGSHVILKDAVEVTKDVINYAAFIAASMSKGKGNVNVIYTNIYNVEKRKFSKPGEVFVESYQHVSINLK
ncbi:hypothetical protein PBCV1_A180R [Paramecium bursaria Chlorella virus 1]|uniref:NFACT RNA-binding domain-containing protein n=1 Tax=Paramecium bursaria Chlorella virus 1 TaxID=10506 RepID=Q84500_PBCV1|nr:hypothetical protein PBCV1_A180R [Paramecium bursaria Chlorella virus 1]AAC96548.1 hypothetical protein [Paramecium bursaria Chlorella virus 1]